MDGFVNQYAIDGYLSGDISLEWTASRCWCNQYACSYNDFIRRRGDGPAALRREFYEKNIRGLERLRTEVLCPVGEAILVHRTLDEIEYIKVIHDIPDERLEAR